MRNAFLGSFAAETEKAAMIARLDRFMGDAAMG